MRADAIKTKIDVDIKIMLVNYFGTVAMTKAVLPSMIQRKEGRILCVGSAQGKFAIPQRSAYGASKHALQVNCVAMFAIRLLINFALGFLRHTPRRDV